MKFQLALALMCLLAALPLAAAPRMPKMPVISVGGIVMSDEPPTNPALPYKPVVDVNVTIEGDTKHHCLTDEKGFFHFEDLPKGPCQLLFAKPGYTPASEGVTIDNSGFPVNIRVTMNPVDGQASRSNGPGTVYVAYAEYKPQTTREGTDLRRVLLYSDPSEVGGRRLTATDPREVDNCNICNDPDHVMMYPPASPSRTTFSKLDASPYWLCFNRTGTRLYVSTKQSAVLILDTVRDNDVLQNLPIDGAVTDLSLSDDGRFVTVATMAPNGVTLIDTSTSLPVASFPAASAPRAAQMRGGRIYCCEGDSAGGTVEVLDGRNGRALGKVNVGPCPTGLAFTPDGRQFLTANSLGASVSVVDAGNLTVIETIRVNAGPRKIAVSPDGATAIVTNNRSDTVSILDVHSRSVRATVKVGREPIGVAVALNGERAYVGCWKDGTVEVVDLKSCKRIHKSTPQPVSSPWGLAIHP